MRGSCLKSPISPRSKNPRPIQAPFPNPRPDCAPYNARKRPVKAFLQPRFRERPNTRVPLRSAAQTRLRGHYFSSDCQNNAELSVFLHFWKRNPIRAPIQCRAGESELNSGPDGISSEGRFLDLEIPRAIDLTATIVSI